jgi:hypothetical protein
MKTHIRYILICLFSLSPIISGAETRTIRHDFDAMFKASPKKLEVENTNQTGTSTQDGIVYTCSGGAEFSLDYSKTGSKLAIFLESSGEKVETSLIQNLDSLRINYYYYPLTPNPYRDITVSISTDGSVWKDVTVEHKSNGLKTVKMPRAGDYYVRIAYKSSYKVYVFQIDYIYIDLSGCPNCFLYKPE